MPIPDSDKQMGTKSPQSNNGPRTKGHQGHPTTAGDGGGSGKKGKGKKRRSQGSYNMNLTPLNPPFDPRMRSVGDPGHSASKMKRGWVQTEDAKRVNFLFNPSELVVNHVPVEDFRTAAQIPEDDTGLGISYASMGSSTNVKLLYDRTYELHSPGAGNAGRSFANRFGVYADVAAWYVLLGMLPSMPTNWESSIIVEPPQPKLGYLFVGPKMVYYGRLAGANVTYSHWTINMIPARCAVDIAFELLPYEGNVLRGKFDRSDFIGPIDPSLL